MSTRRLLPISLNVLPREAAGQAAAAALAAHPKSSAPVTAFMFAAHLLPRAGHIRVNSAGGVRSCESLILPS